MPDWNFRDPAVTTHHRRVADYWLREVGVDGFRLDAVRYFFEDGEEQQDIPETRAWLRDFTAYCHTIKPDCFVIGEVAASTTITADYLNRRSLDSVFEFDFARATVWAVRDNLAGIYAQQLQRMQRAYAVAGRLGDVARQPRPGPRGQPAGRRRPQAAVRSGAAIHRPGRAVHLLRRGGRHDRPGPDPEKRTPMQWTGAPGAGFSTAQPWHAVNPDFERRNVATESSDESSLLTLYRRLIRLNEDSTALRRGQAVVVTTAARNVYAAMRQTDDDVVLVLANFNPGAVPQPDVSAAASNLRTGWNARNELDLNQSPRWCRPGTDRFAAGCPWRTCRDRA